MSKVVVVGGGLGGLAAAARLARAGHAVTVLERAPQVGGHLGVWTDAGFTVDTGPSLLTLPATLRDLFRWTGKPLESVLDLVPLEPLTSYRFADGTRLDVPNSGQRDVVAAYDGALGGRAGEDWRRFYDHAERIWSVVREPLFDDPPQSLRDLARLARRRPADLGRVAPWRSLRDVGRRFFHDPRQVMVLDRYATYAGSDPRRAPAALAVVPYVEQQFGGWWVRGGMRRIADAVAERAERCGATIRTGAEVVAVATDGTRVTGVRLADGERVDADVVVSDVDAAELYGRLLEGAPRARATAVRRLGRTTRSLSGFALLLGLHGRTPGLAQHTVLFPADYDAEFDAVFGRSAAPVPDPTLYVHAPEDPALAPPGDEAWFVLVNAPRHGTAGEPGTVDWTAPGVADGYAEHLLDRLAARGLDVRSRVVARAHRSPADVERTVATPGGAIYGSASHGATAAFLRPGNRGLVEGLYLVGGSTHPGGGMPMVTASAAIVADLVGRAG